MSRKDERRSRRRAPTGRASADRGGDDPPPRWRDRRLAAVVFTALAVKATVLARLGGHPLLQPLGELDTGLYVELGRTVASGGLLAVAQPFFVSPLYVYFLAAIFALGGTIATARALQVVIGAAATGLVFVTARHWFGERTAWLAGALAILTGLFTFYEILILPAALDPFLVALTLACVSRLAVRDRPWSSAAAGASTALLALNRPNALLYGAVVAVWLAARWWRARGSRPAGSALARALVYSAALLAVLLANGLRNYAASREWVLVSSHGGLNFYIGNGPHADGAYSPVPGISATVAGQARDAQRVAEAASHRALTAGEVSDDFYARAWSWMAADPGGAARLWGRKLLLLINRENVPLNFSYAYYSRDESSLLRALVVGPWLLLPFGVVGLFLRSARPRRDGFWLWASFIPVYGASVVAFFVSSRYRMPLLVPLCVSSAAALTWGYEQLRSRNRRALLAPALAAVAAAVLVNWPLGLDDGRGFEQTREAVWLVEQGRVDDALAYVGRVVPEHSHPGLLHYRVGRALAAADRFDAAVDEFQHSLAIDPGELATELELGQALTVTGRAAEAVPHLTAALEGGHRAEVAAPWLVRALAASGARDRALDLIASWPDGIAAARAETALDLGTMALELEMPSRAERWLRLAAAAEPGRAEAHEKLGVALLLQARVGEAIPSLEAARRLDPASASAHLNLAVAYARTGRDDEARVEAQEALRLDPTEPRAAAVLRALGGRR